MKQRLCRLSAIILAIIVWVLPVTTVKALEPAAKYVTVDVLLFNDRNTKYSLPMVMKDEHVYVSADELAKIFSLELSVSESGIVLRDKDAYKLIVFYEDSKEVLYQFGLNILTYEAPFSSIIENNEAWIPFEMTLYLLNSAYMIEDAGIHIEAPKQTANDVLMQMMKKTVGYYSFDMIDEFGYSGTDIFVKGSASHLANFFNGIIGFDSISWELAVTQFFGDMAPYDAKYGDTLATLFCANSEEELRNIAEKIDVMGDGIEQIANLAGNIKDIDVGNINEQLEVFAKQIDTMNPSSVTAYNTTYNQLEEALKSQSEIAEFASGAADVAENIGYALKYMSYNKEFENQDKFSLEAMRNLLSGKHTESLPTATRQRLQKKLNYFESDPTTYAVSSFLENNWLDMLMSKSGLGDQLLGPQGKLVKLVWDLSSNMIPFIRDGLSYTDNFELSLYATGFQLEAMKAYRSKVDAYYNSESGDIDELKECVTSAYTYLKSCYIARQAGIASVENMRKKVPEYFEQLEAKNSEIAETMAQIKMIACSDESSRMLGFGPSMNDQYLRMYNESKLISFLQAGASEDTPNDTSEEVLKEIVGVWTVDAKRTNQENAEPLSVAFGSGIKYGNSMKFSEDGVFSYGIAIGYGGKGTYAIQDDIIYVNYITYEGQQEMQMEIFMIHESDGSISLMQERVDGFEYTLFWTKNGTENMNLPETDEIGENNSEADMPAEEMEDIFSKINGITFTFASGAGAWATEVRMKDDGSFTGYFHDTDMGTTGIDYPHGTRYECHFSGAFSMIEKLDDFTYKLKLKELEMENVLDEEEIVEDVRIIYTGAYGFENADEFLLYLPGRETGDLPEEFLRWIRTFGEITPQLTSYGLYNVNEQLGFYG